MPESSAAILDRAQFDTLFAALQDRGFEVIGPAIADGAIVFERISAAADLPIGWTDEQDGGFYRLKRRDDEALFGYVVGPQSWKRFLHEPRLKLWDARRAPDGSLAFTPGDQEPAPRRAFLGMRSCDLHAMRIQDRVFLGNGYSDSHYAKRREAIFTIAVNCGTAGGTCFCVSMGTGPGVSPETPHDLALTEILDGSGHRFLLSSGSLAGAELLAALPTRPASAADEDAGSAIVQNTARHMGRTLPAAETVPALLLQNLEHPRWDEIAGRCLSCANCTLVCPTCFCTTVEDVTDLTGDHAERWRRWDSCFTLDFSWMPGGSVRQSARSRYRQWMTHKLATWHGQFGSSGCVGCGRCISWCPVGIDLTEETAAIRSSASKPGGIPTESAP
jgi:sulfhydrogenase subunit beta (sulfur reductase)